MNFGNTEINIDIHFNFSSQPCIKLLKSCVEKNTYGKFYVQFKAVYCMYSLRKDSISYIYLAKESLTKLTNET